MKYLWTWSTIVEAETEDEALDKVEAILDDEYTEAVRLLDFGELKEEK